MAESEQNDETAPQIDTVEALVAVVQELLKSLSEREEAKQATDPPSDADWTSRQQAEFNLWCARVGVYGRRLRPMHIRLKDAPEIYTVLLQLLRILASDLKAIRFHWGNDAGAQGPSESQDSDAEKEDDSSDTSSSFSSSSGSAASPHEPPQANTEAPSRRRLEVHVEDTIDRLRGYSKRIEQAAAKHRRERIQLYLEKSGPKAKYGILKMAGRDKAHATFELASDIVRERLAESFARRRIRLDYLKEHQKKRSISEDPNKVKLPHIGPLFNLRNNSHIGATSASEQSQSRSMLPSVQEAPTVPSATTKYDFTPDPEYPNVARTERAKSVLSVSMSHAGFPSSPAAVEGKFQCPYCRLIVPDTEAGLDRWRKHVMEDLEPYFCLDESCQEPFHVPNSFGGLLAHLQDHVPIMYHVDFHDGQHGELDEDSFEAYILSNGKVSEDTMSSLKEASRRKGAFLFDSCPFCGGYPDVLEERFPGRARDTPDAQDELRAHVKRHFQEAALFCLPNHDAEDADVAQGNLEDNSSVALGIGSHIPDDLDDLDESPEPCDRADCRFCTHSGTESRLKDSDPDLPEVEYFSSVAGQAMVPEEETTAQATGHSRNNNCRLQIQLFESLHPVDDHHGHKHFIPINFIDNLITEEAVRKELSRTAKKKGRRASQDGQDKIAKLARQITRLEPDGEPPDTSPRQRYKTFRKIFATLVFVERSSEIAKFVQEDINDLDLPLLLVPGYTSQGLYDLRCSRDTKKNLKIFQGWSQYQIRNFEEWQWTMLAPFFAMGDGDREARHYKLHHQVILPFLGDQSAKQDGVQHDQQSPELLGASGRVFKTLIHYKHHGFHRVLKCPSAVSAGEKCTCVFAIKRLHSQDEKHFHREVDMLKRVSRRPHDHLISLLVTYEHNHNYFLVFPCAEADLETYWEAVEPKPVMNKTTVDWTAQQCKGLAHGITQIHEYGSSSGPFELQQPSNPTLLSHHGDIKPKKVLWFPRSRGSPPEVADTDSERGTLKLSGSGLGSSSSSGFFVTFNYRAPECDLHQGQNTKGRQYDVWTLGCLYLEFITWLLGGKELLDAFREARTTPEYGYTNEIKSNTFFQVELNENGETFAIVKPEVTDFIEKLHDRQNCTQFLHDFLDLVQNHLLVVLQGKPEKLDRFDIRQVHLELARMASECRVSEDYGCKPHPRSDVRG